MRTLLHVKFPLEPFNTLVRSGTIGGKMKEILTAIKPEAVYFTEYEGKRGAIIVVDLKDPSEVPALSEPWFLTFNAEVELHLAMTPDDLEKAGLDTLGKKWG
jgi:hypothetical protein